MKRLLNLLERYVSATERIADAQYEMGSAQRQALDVSKRTVAALEKHSANAASPIAIEDVSDAIRGLRETMAGLLEKLKMERSSLSESEAKP